MFIVIDCGHSKKTAGKRSPNGQFLEYEYNRILGRRIGEKLTELGINWCFTYDTEDEQDLSLTERANVANRMSKIYGAKNVLLISIHHNALGKGDRWYSAKGFSIWTTKGDTISDYYGQIIWEEAKKTLIPKGRTVMKEWSDGDGDYEKNFTVIYKTVCPSVLIEYGFYTNEEDMKWCMSEEGLNAHTELTVNAIKQLKGVD